MSLPPSFNAFSHVSSGSRCPRIDIDYVGWIEWCSRTISDNDFDGRICRQVDRSSLRETGLVFNCRDSTRIADQTGNHRRVVANARSDINRMFSFPRSSHRNEKRQERGLAVVQPLAGYNSDGDVLIQIDRIIAGTGHSSQPESALIARARPQEVLSTQLSEGRFDARVMWRHSCDDLLRIGTPNNLEFRFARYHREHSSTKRQLPGKMGSGGLGSPSALATGQAAFGEC